MEFNSFGPAVSRLGSDSSRGEANSAKVEAGGAETPLAPLTLTTALGPLVEDAHRSIKQTGNSWMREKIDTVTATTTTYNRCRA